MMAARGGDGNVGLYDAATGVAIGDTIAIPDGEMESIALRPDGRELAIGGSPQVGMQICDLDPQHWVNAACRLAGRNLTREEWVTNIGALRHYRPTSHEFPSPPDVVHIVRTPTVTDDVAVARATTWFSWRDFPLAIRELLPSSTGVSGRQGVGARRAATAWRTASRRFFALDSLTTARTSGLLMAQSAAMCRIRARRTGASKWSGTTPSAWALAMASVFICVLRVAYAWGGSEPRSRRCQVTNRTMSGCWAYPSESWAA